MNDMACLEGLMLASNNFCIKKNSEMYPETPPSEHVDVKTFI